MGAILIPRRSNVKNFHLLNNRLFGVLECQLIKEGEEGEEEKPHETEPESKDSETKNEESDAPNAPKIDSKKGEENPHETEPEGKDSGTENEESDVSDVPKHETENLAVNLSVNKDSGTKSEESDCETDKHYVLDSDIASDIEGSIKDDSGSCSSGCSESAKDNTNITFESSSTRCFEEFDISDIPAVQVLCAECESEQEREGDKLDASYVADVSKTVTSNVHEALKDFNIDIDKEELTIEKMKEMCGDEFVEKLRKTVRKNIHDALEAEDINLDKKELPVFENR